SANPPNGSWGIVKVQPTQRRQTSLPRIPPTGVGGSLKVQPTQQTGKPPFRESPNGNWGIVKVLPTQQREKLLLRILNERLKAGLLDRRSIPTESESPTGLRRPRHPIRHDKYSGRYNRKRWQSMPSFLTL